MVLFSSNPPLFFPLPFARFTGYFPLSVSRLPFFLLSTFHLLVFICFSCNRSDITCLFPYLATLLSFFDISLLDELDRRIIREVSLLYCSPFFSSLIFSCSSGKGSLVQHNWRVTTIIVSHETKVSCLTYSSRYVPGSWS